MGSGKRSTRFASPPAVALCPPASKSPPKRRQVKDKPDIHHVPFFAYCTTALGYMLLCILGQLRDMYGRYFYPEKYRPYSHYKGYAPIVDGFERMFHRYIYTRIRDVFNRTITGVPGRTIRVLERHSHDYNETFEYTGKSREVLNLSSYNYLGFSQSEGYCTDQVVSSISKCGVTVNSSPNEVGYSQVLRETEGQVARFVGKPACIIMSQGFATNSTTLPCLVGKGCLILSDELNHSSIVVGARLSGAQIRSVRHNDTEHLERVLRDAIVQGQPKTRKPWRKILVVVEGLYSMEGTLPQLARLVELKRKYKFFIYLDEAHSIGALGARGRGTCDHLGVDPKDIDVMMGTFTKSFGAAGGYIAGSRDLIDRLRITNHSSVYGESMSTPVLQQVQSSMSVISGDSRSIPVTALEDGRRRLIQLAFNSQYFYSELQARGFTLIGDPSSPVIPMMIYHSSKIAAFSRECLREGIAVVVVGYPATPLMRDRVRFCLSAAHTKSDLDLAIEKIDAIGSRLLLKHHHHPSS